MPCIVLRSISVKEITTKQAAIPVPVALRVLIQRRKHNRQNDVDIVADQIAEVLVVPEVERSLGDL
jgi:hypothetical protein